MNKSTEFYSVKQQIEYIYLQADIESLLLKLKANVSPQNFGVKVVEAPMTNQKDSQKTSLE